MKSHLVTKRHLTIQGREDGKETVSQRQQKEKNILKIDGKEYPFKKSDIKLFGKLKNSIEEVERTLRESGKIPDSKRRELTASTIESYLSVMLILHEILSSTLDLGRHSVRRVTDISYTVERNLLDAFLAAGAAARTQPWLAWETMSAYNHLALHHGRTIRRLSGATISALRREVCTLEECKGGVKNLGDYFTTVAIPALQVKENTCTLLENSDFLRLEEYQISQLHNLLGRVKILLEWKRQS